MYDNPHMIGTNENLAKGQLITPHSNIQQTCFKITLVSNTTRGFTQPFPAERLTALWAAKKSHKKKAFVEQCCKRDYGPHRAFGRE